MSKDARNQVARYQAARHDAIALVMRGTSVAFVLTVLALAAMLASQIQ